MNYSINNQPTQLLFIDPTVDDIETLLLGTLPGIESHILSGKQDGVAQITQILQQHPEVNTVHIVSHGSPGCLYLGDSQLCLDNLNIYTSQLQSWAREGLTLILYGCNVAAGDAGEEFVNKLHSLTGANIAASASLTGNAALGGNWQLEVSVGKVVSEKAFTSEAMVTYTGAMAPVEVLTNGNFETGDFTGWNVGIAPTIANGGSPFDVDSSGDGWIVGNSYNGYFSVPAISGLSAFNGFDGGVNSDSQADFVFYLRQNFAVSDAISLAQLSFSFDITGGPSFGGTEDRIFSVRILDSQNTAVATPYIYIVKAGTEDNNPLQNVNLDLTTALDSLSAGTYTLEFHELIPQYYTGPSNFVLDNISLKISANEKPTLTTPTAISYTDTANDDTFTPQTGALTVTGGKGQTLTYGITGGTVSGTTITKTATYGTLTLNSSTGAYTFTPVDGAIEALTSNATESFAVTVSDGTATDSKALAINLTGANDTATLSTLTAISYTDTANDDTFTPQTGTLTASDRDSGQTLTYGITDGAVNGTTVTKTGTYGTLTLNSSTGAYSFTPVDGAIEALTSNATESFAVTVSDGTATDSKALAINLTGVNDTPIVNSATFSIQENTANGTVVGIVTGSDVETSTLSNWAIAGGNTDVDKDGQFAFAINSTTGKITVNDSDDLDFETQSQFNLQVTTSDGSATSNPANVTVNLLNVQEFTAGNDVGNGTSGDDIMDAKDGDDRIYGYDGNDTIFSGTGADIAYGGNGNDMIYGGDGNDRLYGDAGNDILLGEAGVDILYGGAGDDLLNGGLGSDRYYGDAGIDTFVIGVGQGVDSIYGYEKGIDKIQLLGGISVVEKKSGSNLLITSVTETGTEILATVYNALPGQVSYI
jgi:hypothetical protein